MEIEVDVIEVNVIIALKGKFYWKLINNQQGIPYVAGTKREGMPFSGMIKLKLKFLKCM